MEFINKKAGSLILEEKTFEIKYTIYGILFETTSLIKTWK